MYWRKIRKTNRKFTTHERSVSVWKWMNDPNSVAAPRKLNPRFDGCFPFLPHSPSPSVFVLILPCDNITESPSCGKGSERSYFYPSDTLQNMHKQTGLRQHARTHTNTKAQQTMQQECITPCSPLFIRQTYRSRSVQQLHNAITLGGEVSQEWTHTESRK